MEVVYLNPRDFKKGYEPISLSLGDFDGFHLGHQSLALESFANSSYLNAILFLSTSYKNMGGEGEILANVSQRIALANLNRYERVYVLETDQDFFSWEKGRFEELLRDLGVKEIFVGEDYRYGKGAKGNINTLRYAEFRVHKVDFRKEHGKKVSSRDIKEAIRKGDFLTATSLLGRPYEVYGKVVKGKQNGRMMGVPTANLSFTDPYVIPAHGAYYGRAIVRGHSYPAMISVGNNPTFQGESTTVEAHLLDFNLEIYGESIYLSFWDKIRENRLFSSVEELKKQLHEDRESTVEYFKKLC